MTSIQLIGWVTLIVLLFGTEFVLLVMWFTQDLDRFMEKVGRNLALTGKGFINEYFQQRRDYIQWISEFDKARQLQEDDDVKVH